MGSYYMGMPGGDLEDRSGVRYGEEWQELKTGIQLQRPAIVTIGAAGENMTRVASLIHGGGSGAGQGGFGGVFGSKNLKAIAFLGTKMALRDSRSKGIEGYQGLV